VKKGSNFVDKGVLVCYHIPQANAIRRLQETDEGLTEGVKLSGDRKIKYCNRIALRRTPHKADTEGASGESRQTLR